MKYCSVTPNRGGERDTLLKFCAEQIKDMGISNAYIINDPPKGPKPDLVPRIKQGIEMAKRDGFDWIFIIESDDSYPSDYVERYLPHMTAYDFIGDPWTTYYRIDTRRYSTEHHHGRASLFTTAFRVSALDKFRWPADDYVFLDIPLWKHAKKYKCKFLKSGAIGIKGHGFGMTGGNGHRSKLKHEDMNLDYLSQNVTARNFQFYKELMKRF